MPVQQQVSERYWCPGPWPWQWFRTCTRTVTKWCYSFSYVIEHRWGLWCNLEGCENGTLYTWTAFCFNVFGTATFGAMTKCFDNPLNSKGRC